MSSNTAKGTSLAKRALLTGLLVGATILGAASPASAIWGTNDIVPAATLIVPFFETGVNAGTHPHDTLLAVYANQSTKFHYQVFNIDGDRVFGADDIVDLTTGQTWSASLRGIIAGLNQTEKDRVTDGAFYRGFVTINVVSMDTGNSPFAPNYPWGFTNSLTGSIYYTRLSEGSANGLPMIHLEAVDPGADGDLEGFYAKGNRGHTPDRREEIDGDARACAAQLTAGDPCIGDTNREIEVVRARVFNEASLNGSSRVIIFAWNTIDPDLSMSEFCDGSTDCPSSYASHWRTAGGSIQSSAARRLDHVVNIIDIDGVSGSGEFLMFSVPNPSGLTQFYAFSFNTAKPAGGAALNWDAIFEAQIEP